MSSEKINQSLNYQIAMTGIFGALSVVLVLTPFGYIQLLPPPAPAITIMHIPVILATLFGGLIPGIGVGFIFGITSMIRSVMLGSLFFYNPVISVIPRMLFPVFVWLFYKLVSKINRIFAGSFAAAAGTFFHTVIVISMIYFVYFDTYSTAKESGAMSLTGLIKTLGVVFVTNGLWEILAAVVIVTIVFSAFYLSSKRSKISKMDSDLEKEK